MLLHFMGCVLMYLRLKRKNPLSSSIYLVLSTTTININVGITLPSWYVYLILMLFVRGVFVLVVYLGRLAYSKERFDSVKVAFIFILLFVVSVPYIATVPYDLVQTIPALYEYEVT
jgi:hypothetical protein